MLSFHYHDAQSLFEFVALFFNFFGIFNTLFLYKCLLANGTRASGTDFPWSEAFGVFKAVIVMKNFFNGFEVLLFGLGDWPWYSVVMIIRDRVQTGIFGEKKAIRGVFGIHLMEGKQIRKKLFIIKLLPQNTDHFQTVNYSCFDFKIKRISNY